VHHLHEAHGVSYVQINFLLSFHWLENYFKLEYSILLWLWSADIYTFKTLQISEAGNITCKNRCIHESLWWGAHWGGYRIPLAFQLKRNAEVTETIRLAKIVARDFARETLSLKIERAAANLKNSKPEHLLDQSLAQGEKESAVQCSYFYR